MFAELEQRIDRLSRQVAARPEAAMLPQIEATLSEGYARALIAEGRMKQLDRRMEALLDLPGDAAEIRTVARERQHLARAVERLRARLAEMRDDFVAMQRA